MSDNQPTTMQREQTALDELTKPWNDVLSPKESGTGHYMAIDYPPLLDMLREAVGSSLGKTQSGKSPDAERSILNLQAFSLWEHIDGTTRTWLRELSTMRPEPELKAALIQLGGLLQALHASNQIKEQRWLHIIAQFPRWRRQVWEMFDPPRVKELTGECPNCNETAYYALDGARSTALIAYYWKGLTPEAKCQRCGEHWTGETQLLSLGRVLKATIDEVALKEMGVI